MRQRIIRFPVRRAQAPAHTVALRHRFSFAYQKTRSIYRRRKKSDPSFSLLFNKRPMGKRENALYDRRLSDAVHDSYFGPDGYHPSFSGTAFIHIQRIFQRYPYHPYAAVAFSYPNGTNKHGSRIRGILRTHANSRYDITPELSLYRLSFLADLADAVKRPFRLSHIFFIVEYHNTENYDPKKPMTAHRPALPAGYPNKKCYQENQNHET